MLQRQQMMDFFVDDYVGIQKRRVGHKVFADKVKFNYGYRCAITGISSKDFLVASHIIPWAQRKDTRLDPSNGICLSVLLDKAFDKGYITISVDYKVVISNFCETTIKIILEQYENKMIYYPKDCAPNKDFLKWHNSFVFKH
ncbi:hypothetical protein GC097_05710 [Paenibacillus sp. LMG 31457]|uniref:HNH nuclease domain-containing protein n=2 Tax=Paenibacillus planticolens TaxID=2654976 RepID=A0ABX1ZHG5_9BACL|nr:hypothetical protein [Paenibacillus planticolens]